MNLFMGMDIPEILPVDEHRAALAVPGRHIKSLLFSITADTEEKPVRSIVIYTDEAMWKKKIPEIPVRTGSNKGKNR